MHLVLSIALLFAATLAGAMPASVSLREIKNDPGLILGQRLDYWHNQDQKVDAVTVLRGDHDAKFVTNHRPYPSIGFTNGEVWARFAIYNEGQNTETIWLESRYTQLDHLSLYQIRADGSVQSDVQGDVHYDQARPLLYRSPAFSLTVRPGKNVYVLRAQTQGSLILALMLWDFDGFDQHRFLDAIVLGIMFGSLLALLFYNGFLAISFRSQTYFFYFLFLIGMTGTQLSLQGLWSFLLPPEWSHYMSNRGFLLLVGCTNILGLAVTISFLNVQENFTTWRKLLQGLLILSILMTLAGTIIPYQMFGKATSVFVGAASLLLIVTAITAVLRGYRPAIYYMMAWSFILVANLMNTLQYEGVLNSPIILQFNNFPGSVLESILMSLALADRVNFIRNKAERTILELNQELEKHVTQVEALVEERTETIRTILDHVASGFIMVDRQGRVLPGFSRSCHTLLGKTVEAGQSLSQLLEFNAQESKLFLMALDQVYQRILPADVALSQLPKRAKTRDHLLQLEAGEVLDPNGEVKNILFTIQDVTELRRKQREARRNHLLIHILRDMEAFRQFIGSSYEMVQSLKDASQQKRNMFFILHTLKGNCLVFKLNKIAHYVHQLEDQGKVESVEIETLEGLFLAFLTRHHALLKTAWGLYAPGFHLERDELQDLEKVLAKTPSHQLQIAIQQWIGRVTARPLGPMVRSLIENSRRTGRKLGKSIDFRIEGEGLRVQNRAEERVIEMLIHLVRNAVVHGIEDDRLAIGKPRDGRIQLSFIEQGNDFVIRCTDDGRGFVRSEWEQSALDKGLLTPDEVRSMDFAQLVGHVVQGGYSTQRESSLLAGRGVGLEGLYQAVAEAKGTIQLQSQPGTGSTFEIILPRGEVSTHRLAS